MAENEEMKKQFVPSGTYDLQQQLKLSQQQSNKEQGEHVYEFYKDLISKNSKDLNQNNSKSLRTKRKNLKERPLRLSSSSTTLTRSSSAPSSLNQSITFYCDVCNQQITGMEEKKHIHMMPHMLEVSKSMTFPDQMKRPSVVRFGLSKNNIGFKMLENIGWKVDEGLGKYGQGRREPIPTKIKNDKLGIGIKKKEILVVAQKEVPKPKPLTPAQRKKEEEKERRSRQEMLRYLNSDF